MNRPAVWAVLVAAAVAGLLGVELVRSSVKARSAERALKAAQEEVLRANDAVVAERASQSRLRSEADGLQEQLAAMREQLGERPKVREVVRWKAAEPVYVWRAPEEDLPRPCVDGKCPPCPDVQVEVEGASATVETRAGAVAVVGEVTLARVSPLPREVFKVPYSAEASTAFVAIEPPTPPRWMVGPAAGLGPSGWALGATVIGPRVRAWTLEARPTAAVLVGQDGHPYGTIGLTFGLGKR